MAPSSHSLAKCWHAVLWSSTEEYDNLVHRLVVEVWIFKERGHVPHEAVAGVAALGPVVLRSSKEKYYLAQSCGTHEQLAVALKLHQSTENPL